MSAFTLVVTMPGTSHYATHTADGRVTLGRGEDCDVRLNSPLVSRRHAEVALDEHGQLTIRDLRSLNGTNVDGRVLRDEAVAVDGEAHVQIGPFVVVVSRSDGEDTSTVLVPVMRSPARVTIDQASRAALVDGQVAIERLAPLEYRLLQTLVDAAPALVETTALGNAIWEPGQWDVYMLHNLVARVRRKLETRVEDGGELIVTVQGAGYRLA